MDTIETSFRQLIDQAIADRDLLKPDYKSIPDFCSKFGLSRTTAWRRIKDGTVKSMSIGGRVFIDVNQFSRK